MNKLLLIASLVLLAAPAGADTLRGAVEAALAGNPALASARARQDALAETPEQARAAGRLTASADAAGGYDKFDYGKGGGATISTELPIWTGGRVSSAVRAANGDVAAGRQSLRDSRAALLTDVVGAYAELLYDQQAVAIAKADIDLLARQVDEANARFKLGKATRTDVAQLQAQRASADASLAGAQATLATTAAAYRAIVGHDPGVLAPPPPSLAALPGTLDQARSRALAGNPLLEGRIQASQAAAARIDEARANGNPSLSIGAAYGYDMNLAGPNDRTFPRAASAGLILHVPILTGGLVASQVREARANRRAAEFDVESARREAIRSAEAAWADLVAARRRTTASEQGVEAATLALKGVRAEYSFDLRSTLDILVADESLRSAQLALARARSDELVAQAALLRATGRLNGTAFGE